MVARCGKRSCDPPMPKELLTLNDVAAFLGISRRQIERYLSTARYRGVKFPKPAATIGRVRVWRREDVKHWKSQNLRPPTGRPPKDEPCAQKVAT